MGAGFFLPQPIRPGVDNQRDSASARAYDLPKRFQGRPRLSLAALRAQATPGQRVTRRRQGLCCGTCTPNALALRSQIGALHTVSVDGADSLQPFEKPARRASLAVGCPLARWSAGGSTVRPPRFRRLPDRRLARAIDLNLRLDLLNIVVEQLSLTDAIVRARIVNVAALAGKEGT